VLYLIATRLRVFFIYFACASLFFFILHSSSFSSPFLSIRCGAQVLAAVSDKMKGKGKQAYSCFEKDQSFHLFGIP